MHTGEKTFGVVDWGTVPYAQACVWQSELVNLRHAGSIPDLLILCEHPPVITLGRNADRKNILASDELLAARGVELHSTNRGGDVTYHGPGQLVGYPILNLKEWKQDVAAYVRALEEVLIRVLAAFDIAAQRLGSPPSEPLPNGKLRRSTLHTGAWVTSHEGKQEKIAAIGVHLSRWITSHGFALNVSTDLGHFDLIVPCGIADKGVTSMARTTACIGSDEVMDIQNVRDVVTREFAAVFNRVATPIPTETWENWIGAHQTAAS